MIIRTSIKAPPSLAKQEIKLVIFDIAGTVIEDAGQVPTAFTAALGNYGIEVTSDSIREVRGASKREVIKRFVERQPGIANADVNVRTEEIYNSFRRTLAGLYERDGVREIPGATEIFAWLRHRGVRVALNTGFDRMITELLLDSMRWEGDLINAVACGDDVLQGRPAPELIFKAMERSEVADVHHVANVGDTLLDLRAGQNAGVRFNVGVLSGAHTKEQLEHEPHTHLLSSVVELPALWAP
jgi:phosphonatase-like hydrolase